MATAFQTIPTLHQYARGGMLVERYENFPRGRYVTLLVQRRTESEAVFRTEGSGEGLVKEATRAGVTTAEIIRRVVISKRKQTAVERRTGRELLREHDLLKTNGKTNTVCAINTNAPCERCIDCRLYGFAVGGGGAQKSRVMTSDAFSLLGTGQVLGKRTGNATFDNGTMRNPLTNAPSTAIYEEEYVRPGTHFLDMETLKDVMPGELAYVIGNLLRSTRYGAISSRIGRVQNRILALLFSDCELASNLELTQRVYDALAGGTEPDFPLEDEAVRQAGEEALLATLDGLVGRTPTVLRGDALGALLGEVAAVYREPEVVRAMLGEVEAGYPANG